MIVDVDLPSIIAGALVGVVAGSLIRPFLSPWSRRAERAGEVVAGDDPVDLLVDTDQAVIWAGAPPWVGFSYYFAGGLPEEDPPEVGFDWSRWAYKHGGIDATMTMLQVTIQARLNATVVLDAPIIRIIERRSVSGGVIGTFGAGGADLTPRHFRVDLDTFDPPIVEYRNEEFEVVASPAFKLGSGDAERFHVWAYATRSELVEWSLELPVIINGHRRTLPIHGPTDFSFRTLGHSSGVEEVLSYGGAWQPREEEHGSQD